MAVLVTGGLGAIGSWALRSLIEQGERPVAVDTRNDRGLVADLDGRFDLEIGDVLDPAFLYRVGYGYSIDRICHLAALMPPPCQAEPALGFRVNTVGTIGMLELARNMGVKRFVYTSSKAVYGNPQPPYGHPTYEPIPEEHPYRPTDVYGASKVSSELMIGQYASIYQLDSIVLRLGGTYGPGKLERHGEVGLVSRMLENAHAGLPFRVDFGGEERSDHIYNKDVGRAVAVAAFAEHRHSRVYNISSGDSLSLFEAAEVVRSLVPGVHLDIGGDIGLRQKGVGRGSTLTTAKAADELGFVAHYSFAQGARDYLDWLDGRQAKSSS